MKTEELARQYRYLEIESLTAIREATDTESATYDISLSSEFEVQRWFGRETLAHEGSAIDMRLARRGLSLLLDHYGEQVGVVENIRLDKNVLRGEMRFSRSARGREIEQDVQDKIRKFISLGYDPMKMKIEEDANGNLRDRKIRVTRWAPLEVSIVKIPADPTVGTDRSGTGAAKFPVEIEGEEPAREVRSMDQPTVVTPSPAVAPAARAEVVASPEEIAARANTRAAEIYKLCRTNGIAAEKADEFVRGTKTIAEVGLDILNLRMEMPRSNPSSEALAAMSVHERHRLGKYSVRKALLNSLALREGRAMEPGVEADWHNELVTRAAKLGYSPRGGILIPTQFQTDQERAVRTLDSKTAGKGPEVVQDQRGDFIDLLRPRSVLARLGVTQLPGLTGGPVVFPKQTGPMTAQWIGENPPAGVTASDLALGVVTLQPKTLMAATAYARQLLVQSSPAIDNLIDADSAIVMALALDKAGIHGKAADGQPTGVYLWPNVQPKAYGGTVEFAELIDALGLLADANADYSTIGWVMTPLLAASLMRTLVANAAGSDMIWTGTFQDGVVAGYRAMASSQCSKVMNGSDETGGSSHAIVAGVWSDMVQGLWGVIEAVTDPYTAASQALIKVTWFQMADQIIRHPEAFVKGTGATP